MTMDDEFAKIEWLTARLGRRSSAGVDVRLGIGDDAAVVDFGGRPTVVTVDTQVEGVHFTRSIITEAELGARSVLAAASDVWAMAAKPASAVVALTMPPDYPDASFRALVGGLDEGAEESGAEIVGGNLSQASVLSITTTVFGVCSDRVLSRSGAKAGDTIYVTGALGAAALGFAVLDRVASLPQGDAFKKRWRRPPSHHALVPTLVASATAAIDVSDGCLQDLAHLCRASGVGAVLHAHTLPRAPGYEVTCNALDLDPLKLALNGGEDYEILFTAPDGAVPQDVATSIGRVTDETGIMLLDAGGSPMEIPSAGYRHFS